MGSEPSRSDGRAPLARKLTDPRNGGSLGLAARTAGASAGRTGLGLSDRLRDQPAVVDPTWGVWPRPASEAPETAQVLRELGPALAAFAQEMWRRKGGDQAPPRRGLPLLARRDGDTELGDGTGPGGLARAMQPQDRPASRDLREILEGVDAAAMGMLGGGR